jgi:low affinity Fe/Cu permease
MTGGTTTMARKGQPYRLSGNDAMDRANVVATDAANKATDGPISKWFTNLASATSRTAGRPATFALCCLTVVVWAVTGPMFHYSDTWQLVINTGTTIITFLMVFLIQNTQNRDQAALQAKLDELIRASHDAPNAYMGIEKLGEHELEDMREQCAAGAKQGGPPVTWPAYETVGRL